MASTELSKQDHEILDFMNFLLTDKRSSFGFVAFGGLNGGAKVFQ